MAGSATITPIGPGESTSTVWSALDRTVHAVFAGGNVAALYAGYCCHASSLGPLAHATALAVMRKALAGATLQLALLPPDQHCSWTFNFAEPRMNVFLAGDNATFRITGRIFETHVKTSGANRLYVETQRPKHEPARGVVDFEGLDVVEAFHEYYRRSLQMRAKLFELERDEYVLVQGLPIVDMDWFEALDASAVRAMVDGGLEPIEERTYRFECGCDIAKMIVAISDMFAGKLDDLFEGRDDVEVQCPRCGRYWTLERETLEGSPQVN